MLLLHRFRKFLPWFSSVSWEFGERFNRIPLNGRFVGLREMVSVNEYWFHCVWAWTRAGERFCFVCVCVFFLTFVTGTTTATESTVQRDNTSHMYNTSTFFLIFFFCARCIRKNQSGLKVVRTHLFAHWLCFWIGFCGRNDLTDFYDFWYT